MVKIEHRHVSNGDYSLGFIGALIYYLQQAAGFWTVMIGIFKAIFWPAFLVYQLMSFLKM